MDGARDGAAEGGGAGGLPRPSVDVVLAQAAAFVAEDRWSWASCARAARAVEIGIAVQELTRAWVDAIRDANRDDAWREEGHASATAWIANTCGVTAGEAARRVKTAKLLHEQDLTRKHFDAGDLSAIQIEELARVHPDREAQYAAEEADLLGDVMRIPTRELRTKLVQWARQRDEDKAPDPAELPEEDTADRSWFHASRTLGGFLALDGLFTPEGADIIEARLAAETTVPRPMTRAKSRNAGRTRSSTSSPVTHASNRGSMSASMPTSSPVRKRI